jgi:Domain of unknown function (DUF2760)
MGLGKRVSYALRCFLSILFRGEIPPPIARELVKTPAVRTTTAGAAELPAARRAEEVEKLPSESFERAIQMLALLQRDGRLIDFLAEDVASYPDAQLGAAVRTVHETCRQVLESYLKLEPIIAADENQLVTVPAGFDPASIKLIGNVTGKLPLRGLLRHPGWRAIQVNLPSLPEGPGRSVVAPAEVEVS